LDNIDSIVANRVMAFQDIITGQVLVSVERSCRLYAKGLVDVDALPGFRWRNNRHIRKLLEGPSPPTRLERQLARLRQSINGLHEDLSNAIN
jgi:hypothetical protein